MRLLFVSHCFPPLDQPLSKIGGMQRVGMDLLGELQRHDDVQVDELVLRTSGIRTYVRFPGFFVSGLRRIRTKIIRKEVDAVLFSAMPSAAMAAGLGGVARRAGVPLAAIAHGHDVIADNAVYQRFLPRIFDRLDVLLPVSRSTGAAAQARGMPADRIEVVPNGINAARFGEAGANVRHDRQTRVAARAGVSPDIAALDETCLLLCSVGRQVKRKGHEWFISHVMPRLDDNVHLVLGGSGPRSDAIALATRQAGMAHRVHALGVIGEDALARLYGACDLFVMPNVPVNHDMEGFGVVMLEAGLCGLPSVASDLEGISDVISEGVNGHLCEAENPQAFATLINGYAKAPGQLAELGRRARTHTLETFNWATIAQRIVDIVQERLRGRAGK